MISDGDGFDLHWWHDLWILWAVPTISGYFEIMYLPWHALQKILLFENNAVTSSLTFPKLSIKTSLSLIDWIFIEKWMPCQEILH